MKRPSRRAASVAAVVLLPVVVASAVFFWQARDVQAALQEARSDAAQLQDRLVDGDSQGAKDALTQLQRSTERARSSVDGVLWSIGSWVPVVGDDIDAVRVVATELDRVADQAMTPIVDVSQDVSANTFSPKGGSVRVDALEAVGPALSDANEVLEQSRRVVDEIDVDSLIPLVRDSIGDAKAKIDSASSVANSADLAARLLPALLGADGPRRYLLINQNNAEIRPTGGIAGSYAIITADNGKLSLSDGGSIRDVPTLNKPVVQLTDDELGVFPETLGTDLRDINITPDFPRTAQIAQSLIQKRLKITVDGVLSIDPVALSYLLAGTGPITFENGSVVTEDNAVSTLLNRVYLTIKDPQKQDNYFASATGTIFDTFASGAGDPTRTLQSLVRGIEENRIAFWSAKADEQELIHTTALAGQYVSDDGDVPHVGVYLSDAASTKMEYYLDFETVPVAVNCLADNRQVITTTTTLTSNAPATLPTSVTGIGDFVKRGSMRLNVRLFAPFEGEFTSVRIGDTPLTVQSGQLDGRPVTNVSVLLGPGESATITANMTSGREQAGRPVFSTTPGIKPTRNDYPIDSACRD